VSRSHTACVALFRRLPRAAALALLALAVTSPARAGESGATPGPAVAPFGVDLSLSSNPFHAGVRLPLVNPAERPAGGLTPYLSAGATDSARNLDATAPDLSRREIEASRASQRMDVGAGLNWNLTERFQLFGELGFQRAREQSYSLFGTGANRDGTYIKGGVTIRVP
jgi:hypothetical protein